jgi:putative ABC transport system ATP-binding protein
MDCDGYRRDHAAVIYQNYNLFLQLTAIENVMCPLILKKIPKAEAKKRAAEKLARVGLDEKFHRRFPSQLSGGEQQRVAIARALATEADVILADEPTGNLDVENGMAIVGILSSLAKEGDACVIIVTHDNTVAEKADVIYHMSDGRLDLD